MIPSFSRLFFVLGMHRSGTSVLARALQVLGIFLGTPNLARADNPKGFFEHPDFVLLNEELLTALGRTWKTLDPVDPKICAKYAQSDLGTRAATFLRTFCTGHSYAALKDPRTVRLLPFWLALCRREEIPVSLIIAIRNPENVADSLEQRDGMQDLLSYVLWVYHSVEAFLYAPTLKKTLVSYDALLEHPTLELTRIANAYALPLSKKDLRTFTTDFLEHALRHHTTTPKQKTLPLSPTLSNAVTCYRTLLELAQEPFITTLDPVANYEITSSLAFIEKLLHAND